MSITFRNPSKCSFGQSKRVFWYILYVEEQGIDKVIFAFRIHNKCAEIIAIHATKNIK